MVYYTSILAVTVALTAGAAFALPSHYRDDGVSYSCHDGVCVSYSSRRYLNDYRGLDDYVLDRRAEPLIV